MTDNRWQIEKVHVTMNAAKGDVLAVVSYAGEDCGIARNGEPLRDYRWDVSCMAECTAALVRLAGARRA